MQTKRLKHIGVDSFFAERQKLLNIYDHAKQQDAEDIVKTDHGNVAEILIRDFLNTFLPKRYGVCKGHIITPNINYEGDLEEWDVIIYDAIDSPILYSRENIGLEDEEKRRAIPIEYVRAVVEVKATLTPAMVEKSITKLRKLQLFLGENTSDAYPEYLCSPFVCTAIFIETKVKDLTEYRKALDNFIPIVKSIPLIPFMGALVLRSQREPTHSGYLQALLNDQHMPFPKNIEMSSEFLYQDGKYGYFGSFFYGVNSYPRYIFDLLACIKGIKTNKVSSLYGLDFKNTKGSRLF